MRDWHALAGAAWPAASGPVTLSDDRVQVWAASLEQPAPVQVSLFALLTPPEQARVERYLRPVSQQQATVSRGLLRTLLAAYTGIAPSALVLSEGPQHKPFLAFGQDAGDLRFNVSHSGSAVLFAFCRGREVGIDVETIHRVTNMAGVARRSFSRREFAIWEAAAPADQRRLFFHFWCHKESVIKACGRGMLVPLDQFETPEAASEVPASVHLVVPDSPETAWFVRSLDPCAGYAGALCVAGKAMPIQTFQVTSDFFDGTSWAGIRGGSTAAGPAG